jgi:hypothetical protein
VVGTVIDNSAVVVSWNGTFELVDLEWDLDGTFASLVGSLADSSLNEHTITVNRRDRILFQVITEDNRVWRNNEQVISATTQSTRPFRRSRRR